MLNIPVKVRELFTLDNIKKDVRVEFPNGEYETIYGDSIVQGTFSFTESLCSQNDIQLGLCEASVVTFEAVGLGNVKGVKIKVDCLIDCSSLGTEWCDENAETNDHVEFPYYVVPYGIFFIDKCPKKFGATKDYRTITAYTKQAYDDWEVPESIKNFISMGWYRSLELILPLRFILDVAFPNMMGNEYTSCPKNLQSTTVRPKMALRYRQIGTETWQGELNNMRMRYIKASLGTLATITYGNDTLTYGVSKYRAGVGNNYLNYLEQTKSQVKSNMAALGYESDNIDEYFNQFKQLTIKTKGSSKNRGYKTYMNNSYIPDSLQEPYYKEGLNVVDAIFRAYITNPEGVNQVTTSTYDLSILVPCGIWLVNQIPDMFLDGITIEEYIDDTSYFEYITDSNTDGQFIPIVYDKATSFRATLAGEVRTINGYFSETTLAMRDIVQSNAELNGLLGRFNRYGEYEQIAINGRNILYPEATVYPGEVLYPNGPLEVRAGGLSYAEWEDEFNKPYDRIEVEYKNASDETIYAYVDLVDHEDESYDPKKYTTYNLTNNWFIKNQTFTAAEIQAILDEVKYNIEGMQYMPSEIDLRGLPYLEAGDYLQYFADEQPTKTLVLRNTLQGETYLTQTVVSN